MSVQLWTSQRQTVTERLTDSVNLTKKERLQLAGCAGLRSHKLIEGKWCLWEEWWEGLRRFCLPCTDTNHMHKFTAVLRESGQHINNELNSDFKQHNITACEACDVILVLSFTAKMKNTHSFMCHTSVHTQANTLPLHTVHSLIYIHYSSVMQVVYKKDADFPFQTETVRCSCYRRTEIEETNRLLYSKSPFIMLESRKLK